MMDNNKKQRLEEAIVSIRRVYGEDALRPLGDAAATSTLSHLSTGFGVLDRALGIGGLPKRHLTHVTGVPTSGAMTLAYKVLAQAAGEAVAVVDLPQTFDADYAVRCGVDAAALVLIQPSSLHHSLETLTGLLDTAAAAILAPDPRMGKLRVDNAVLNRLMTALHQSSCVLLLVEQVGT